MKDFVIDVCQRWERLTINILSKKVHLSIYSELPPSFVDPTDLSLTRELAIAPSWSVNWHKLAKYGLTRHYYDEILKQCNPFILQSLIVSITKANMPVLMSFHNLTSLTIQLKNHSWPEFVPALDQLPKLQVLHAQARGGLSVDDFATINKFCPDLTNFSFPHNCHWDNDPYLAILKQSKIRKISPWSGLGGKNPQSIKSVMKVLTEMSDLVDFELYLKKHPSSEVQTEYNDLSLLPEIMAKHQSVKRVAVFICNDITRAEAHNYHNRLDASVLDLNEIIQNLPNLEELMLNNVEISATLYRTIRRLTGLKKLMLIEIEVNEGFEKMVSNPRIESITIERPANLDYDGVETLATLISNLTDLKNLSEVNLNISTEEMISRDLLGINDMIQNSVLEMMESLSDQLLRLNIGGSWVNNQLVSIMPEMKRLEYLNFTPYDHFRAHRYSQHGIIQGQGYVAEVGLSVQSVLTFTRSKCPALLEPRFLRHNSLFRQLPNENTGTIIPSNLGERINHELIDFMEKKDTLTPYEKRQQFSTIRSINNGVNFDHSFAEWKSYCENGLF